MTALAAVNGNLHGRDARKVRLAGARLRLGSHLGCQRRAPRAPPGRRTRLPPRLCPFRNTRVVPLVDMAAAALTIARMPVDRKSLKHCIQSAAP